MSYGSGYLIRGVEEVFSNFFSISEKTLAPHVLSSDRLSEKLNNEIKNTQEKILYLVYIYSCLSGTRTVNGRAPKQHLNKTKRWNNEIPIISPIYSERRYKDKTNTWRKACTQRC